VGEGVGVAVGVGEGVDWVCAPAETASTNNKKTNTRDFLIMLSLTFYLMIIGKFVFYRRDRFKETMSLLPVNKICGSRGAATNNKPLNENDVARFAGSADLKRPGFPQDSQSLALGLAKTAASQLDEFVRSRAFAFGQRPYSQSLCASVKCCVSVVGCRYFTTEAQRTH